MDTNGSGDRHQVQATAGRFAGRGPDDGRAEAGAPLQPDAAAARPVAAGARRKTVRFSLSEEETGTEAAKESPKSTEEEDEASRPSFQSYAAFLENLRSPPAMSDDASDHGSNSSTSSSPNIWAGLDPDDGGAEDGAPTQPDAAAARPIAAGARRKSVENAPGSDRAPPHPPHVCLSSLDEGGMKIEAYLEEEDPSRPSFQSYAAFLHNLRSPPSKTPKKSVQQTPSEDVPMTPWQVATDLEGMDQAIREPAKDAKNSSSGMDPPADGKRASTPAQRGAAAFAKQGRIKEKIGDILANPPTSPNEDEDAEAPVSVLPRDPSARPPPQSMPQSQDSDAESSTLELEATMVETPPEAIVVPDAPIYGAVQVADRSPFEKNKKLIIGAGIGLLVGAVVAGVAVSSNNGSSDVKTIVPEGVVASTALSSEFSSPSEAPSLQLTARPSESSSPSQFPSPRFTLRPSRSSNPSKAPSRSLRPIQSPSASFRPSESIVPSQSSSPSLRPSKSFSPSTYWSTFDWNRQGLDFNGDTPNDRLGYTVAMSADASTMAVSAPGLFFNEDRPGHVKVYRRGGEASGWEPRGETIYGEANGDFFGRSLALSEDGTYLAIGAPIHNSVGLESGQVKLYEWDVAALKYLQIGATLYGAAPGGRFGWSLDVSNSKILAVGAPFCNSNGANTGQVTVYAWDDASSSLKQRGPAVAGNGREEFGVVVRLAGNGQTLAVSAYYNDFKDSDSGVKVFQWNEATLTYVQLGELLLGEAAGNVFGVSVSFSRDGTTLAIGAPRHDKNGPDCGQVKVFAWDEDASNFKQIGQSLYGAASDWFGISNALSSDGKTLAVGAHQFFSGGPGYVEVFGWDEAASDYKRLGQSIGGEASGDWFGWALDLAGNGRVLAVGAPVNNRNGDQTGRVEVFDIEL